METSTVSYDFPSLMQAAPAKPEAASLCRLSAQLKCLLEPEFADCADTEIVLAASGGKPVAAHKCILMARSSVIRNHFYSLPTPAAAPEKQRLYLADLVPGGRHIGRDALVAVLVYMYTGGLTWSIQEWACMDEACRHNECRPAINFVVECMYAASGFQITELASLVKHRLFYLVDVACDEDIIPIIHVADTCQLPNLRKHCIDRVAKSTLVNKYLEKQLPCHIYNDIKALGQCSFLDVPDNFIIDPENEKTVRNIHDALDSGNVDLVATLLKQSAVTLDDALAIHYAAAKCEPKVLAELLKLDSANVNLRNNNNGYTPLHMACMRLEPNIVLSLVNKGASVLERTPDGRDALTICKRLTRQKDINRDLKEGQESSNSYLCISIMEQKLTKGSSISSDLDLVEETVVTPLLVDNFDARLMDLENRVSMAKLLFPSQAQLAIDTAEADSTEEFSEEVGLIETPSTPNRKKCERLDALTKTVELGRQYFPSCSDILDKLCDECLPFESGNPEDQIIKRMHFFELKEEVRKAFNKDKAAVAAKASAESSPSPPRFKMLILDTSPSQAVDATDSPDATAPSSGPASQGHNAGTASGRLELQSANLVVDGDIDVGSKRKRRSSVWNEFKRVKLGDNWFAICRWCNKSLTACSKNGTNHLHRHLSTRICQSRQVTINQSTLKLSQNPRDNTGTLEKNVFDQEVARTVFGTGERIISAHRSRLASQVLEALMCMQASSRAGMLGPDSSTVTSPMTCMPR